MDSIDYLTDIENVHLCILLPLSTHILADFLNIIMLEHLFLCFTILLP